MRINDDKLHKLARDQFTRQNIDGTLYTALEYAVNAVLDAVRTEPPTLNPVGWTVCRSTPQGIRFDHCAFKTWQEAMETCQKLTNLARRESFVVALVNPLDSPFNEPSRPPIQEPPHA